MSNIKGPAERPFTPQISSKEIEQKKGKEEKLTTESVVKQPARPGIGRGPEFDTHALATRMAILATEAKEKELKFEDIVDRIIQETGMTNPQSAMEEANRKVQQEIENELERIKENKDLMEEAESWQDFAEVLAQMSEEQVEGFLGLLQETIRTF